MHHYSNSQINSMKFLENFSSKFQKVTFEGNSDRFRFDGKGNKGYEKNDQN